MTVMRWRWARPLVLLALLPLPLTVALDGHSLLAWFVVGAHVTVLVGMVALRLCTRRHA